MVFLLSQMRVDTVVIDKYKPSSTLLNLWQLSVPTVSTYLSNQCAPGIAATRQNGWIRHSSGTFGLGKFRNP